MLLLHRASARSPFGFASLGNGMPLPCLCDLLSRMESPGARPRLFMKHTWRTQRAHAVGTCASGARSRYHAVCSHTQTRRTLLGPAISTRRIRCRMANYSQIRSLLCMFFKCVGLVTSAIEVKSSGAGQSIHRSESAPRALNPGCKKACVSATAQLVP